MIKINCKPCFAFDALAAITLFKANRDGFRNDIPYVKEQLEKYFAEIEIAASNCYFNYFIEHYSFDEIEKMGLNEFAESYPNCIKGKDYEKEILKGIDILVAMDFTKLWEIHCLPFLSKQCDGFNSVLKDNTVSGVLSDIQNLKPDKEINDINIYLTYFSWPVSFNLSPTSYLTNHGGNIDYNIKSVLRMFAHELIHGVSNEKSRSIYKNMYKNDDLLKKTNHVLFVNKGSPSDEEEFVVALEHYISFKNGIITKKEAFESLFFYYESCMPIAIIIFAELLFKEIKIPDDINSWIYGLFESGVIKVNEIEQKVNSILPGYVDNFIKIWYNDEK